MAVECSICLDSMWLTHDLSAVHCGHLFHSRCILTWIETNPNCPKCRGIASAERVVKIFVESGTTSNGSSASSSSNVSVADLRAENAVLRELLDEQLAMSPSSEGGRSGAPEDAAVSEARRRSQPAASGHRSRNEHPQPPRIDSIAQIIELIRQPQSSSSRAARVAPSATLRVIRVDDVVRGGESDGNTAAAASLPSDVQNVNGRIRDSVPPLRPYFAVLGGRDAVAEGSPRRAASDRDEVPRRGGAVSTRPNNDVRRAQRRPAPQMLSSHFEEIFRGVTDEDGVPPQRRRRVSPTSMCFCGNAACERCSMPISENIPGHSPFWSAVEPTMYDVLTPRRAWMSGLSLPPAVDGNFEELLLSEWLSPSDDAVMLRPMSEWGLSALT